MRVVQISEKSHNLIMDIMTELQNKSKEKVPVHQAVEKLCDSYEKHHKKKTRGVKK